MGTTHRKAYNPSLSVYIPDRCRTLGIAKGIDDLAPVLSVYIADLPIAILLPTFKSTLIHLHSD